MALTVFVGLYSKKEQELIFQRKLLPANPEVGQLHGVADDYKAILLATLNMIADRYDRRADYHWIDTKRNAITGEDFPSDDPVRGQNVIYGWIQARALESLAVHLSWLGRCEHSSNISLLQGRIENILVELLEQIRVARQANSGHLFFFMTPHGQPFSFDANQIQQPLKLSPQSPYNFTDLFAAKGMYVAGQYLRDDKITSEAKKYCLDIIEATLAGKFVSDQQRLAPSNSPDELTVARSHSPFMIQISTAGLLARYEKDTTGIECGLKLIDYILSKHVNLNNRWPQLQPFDFVEYIDNNDNPYLNGGRIISDPGHCLEFVGLTLKFTAIAKKVQSVNSRTQRQLEKIEALMPMILKRNFSNGLQYPPGGICKSFDLIRRKAVNTDMPWWSLPETMRAALQCHAVAADETVRNYCLSVFSKCHNALVTNYIRPEFDLMAIQTLSKDGEIIDNIPAVPDADPGYHTGLCLIDILNTITSISPPG